MPVCKRVLYSGMVQGVGFRFTARRIAPSSVSSPLHSGERGARQRLALNTMTTDFVTLLISCSVLALVQLLAALPWVAAVDPRTFFTYLRRPEFWLYGLIVAVAVGA